MATSSVRVVLRFRPLNKTEKEQGPESCVEFQGSNEVLIVDKEHANGGGINDRLFTYDGVLNPSSVQEDVFKIVGEPTVDNVLRGYNGTILAYGQTGSGKTHSMLGPEGGTVDFLTPTSPQYEHRGVIPRVIEALFGRLAAIPAAEVSWKVQVSVFELYKENIQDLLTEGPQQEYRIREDTINGRGIYVDNLYTKKCLSASELLEAIRIGVSRRKVASTKSNETSSRSHSLTVVTLEQINHVQDDTVTVSRLNLVDLAGSEKVGKTQATGERLKEAQTINLSLTLLGNVIYKLTDGKSGYIPYRNSKLTRILQDSFGGNSITTLMCHCSVATYNREETISTMRFASRAKQIRNKPRVNRDLSHKELQLAYAQAIDRIRGLEEKLQILSGQGSHISPSRANRSPQREKSEADVPVDADLQETITNLLVEIEDHKKELYSNQEELSTAKQQIEFYKAKVAEAESALAESQSVAKRDETLFQRRLLDLQTENERLQQDLAEASKRASSWVTSGDLLEKSNLPQQAIASDVGVTSRRIDGAGHIGNLRRLGDKEVDKKKISGESFGPVAVEGATGTMMPLANGIDTESVAVKPIETFDLMVDDPSTQTRFEPAKGATGPATTMGMAPLSKQDTKGVQNGRVDAVEAGILSVPHIIETYLSAQKSDASTQAQIGQSESELLLSIAEGQKERNSLQAANAALTKKLTERDATIERLGGQLEVSSNRNDELLKELDNLRQQLEAKEKENDLMRRILADLNINIEEQMALLGSEQERNAWLRAEADKLRQKAQTLQDSQEQQEYCDMANMELIVKAEDMDAVENELGYLSYAALTGGSVSEGTRLSCLDTLKQLDSFLSRLLQTLQGRVFNTSNLESQRLAIVSDAIKLQDRAESARTLLSDTTNAAREPKPVRTPANEVSLRTTVAPSVASAQATAGGSIIPPPAQAPVAGPTKTRPNPPTVASGSKALPRRLSSNALAASSLGASTNDTTRRR